MRIMCEATEHNIIASIEKFLVEYRSVAELEG